MSVLTVLRHLLTFEADPEPPAPESSDRADLLRELEVAVPAPERVVGWEAARGAQRFSKT